MKKYIWIIRAYFYMLGRAGFANLGMCASLYESYAIDWEMSPSEAVDEDMSYWGD